MHPGDGIEQRDVPLLGLVRDAIIVRAFGGTIRYWNGGAATLYGWEPESAIRHTPEALLRTRFPQPIEEIVAATARAGAWSGELTQTARDGTALTVASRWFLRRDERGVAIVQIDTDITARKRLEAGRATLLAAQEAEVARLGELARLKADFTAMVAHELGGPLAALAMLAEMLEVEGLDAGARDRALATIRSEVALLQALARDVGAAASVERDDFAVHPGPVPLAPLLADAAAFAATLPGQHPLALDDATARPCGPTRRGSGRCCGICSATRPATPRPARRSPSARAANRAGSGCGSRSPTAVTGSTPTIWSASSTSTGAGAPATGDGPPGWGSGSTSRDGSRRSTAAF